MVVLPRASIHLTVWVLAITFLLGPGEYAYGIEREYATEELCRKAVARAKENLHVIIIYIGCSERVKD